MHTFESELDRALRLLEGGIVGKGNDKTGYPVYYTKPYPIWVNEQKATAKAAILAAYKASTERIVKDALRAERKRRKLGKKRRLETEKHIAEIPLPLVQNANLHFGDSGNEAERC